MTINEEYLQELKLMRGQVILIHLLSGIAICGAYLGNYNSSSLEFDFENHGTGDLEKVRLFDIGSLIT